MLSRPRKYITPPSNRGWTGQEAKDFVAEVQSLKELWYDKVKEPTTSEALANLREAYESTNGFARIHLENEERRRYNEIRRKERLRRIELENRNLEWPKPDFGFDVKTSFDYWKDGCLYCQYKPKTTHDYEVHIVTQHPGKPAYPGPADIERYGLTKK